MDMPTRHTGEAEEVFRQHRNLENKNFDNFYQSQILWMKPWPIPLTSF
jgi:hypothetical protein